MVMPGSGAKGRIAAHLRQTSVRAGAEDDDIGRCVEDSHNGGNPEYDAHGDTLHFFGSAKVLFYAK